MDYVDGFTSSLMLASEYITAGLVITFILVIGVSFLMDKLGK